VSTTNAPMGTPQKFKWSAMAKKGRGWRASRLYYGDDKRATAVNRKAVRLGRASRAGKFKTEIA
jgi:hypothetical protein